MRILTFLAVATTLLPAAALRQVTVEQLSQVVKEQVTANGSDKDIARQIGNLELTQQLTPLAMDQLTQELKAGPKTTLALDLLASSSAFLEPPAEELPAKSAPGVDERRSIIRAAVGYVVSAKQRLPNLMATRITRSFDDTPLVVSDQGASAQHLHAAGTFTQEITYRDGHEVINDSSTMPGGKTRRPDAPPGLSSWGEFGPLLATILADAANGQVTWYRWEQTSAGLAAVFQYKVPQSASHYVVEYCCVRGPDGPDLDRPWNNAPGDTPNSYTGTPGYHGNLYLDPVTGAFLRVTLQAELKSSDAITRTEIAVRYGPVEIGGKTYICPVWSVAISSTRVHLEGEPRERMVLRINDVHFTGYHRFGATARMLPSTPAR